MSEHGDLDAGHYITLTFVALLTILVVTGTLASLNTTGLLHILDPVLCQVPLLGSCMAFVTILFVIVGCGILVTFAAAFLGRSSRA